MKRFLILNMLLLCFIVTGCDKSHNFMDVDNANAKEDLQNLIGSGNIPKINTSEIIPDSLSGTRNDIKGRAEKYYTGKVEGYVDKAKEGLSGATEKLKGFYNDSIDDINGAINEKVNGEINKFKIK